MSMEKSRILDLYKREIITLEEAVDLLDAMDEEMPEEEIRQEDKVRRDANNRARNFTENLKASTDKIINDTRDFLRSEKVRNATEKTASTVKEVCGTIFAAISEDINSIYNSAKKTIDKLDMSIVPAEDGQISIDGYAGDTGETEHLIQHQTLGLADNHIKIDDRTISSEEGITLSRDVERIVIAVPENVSLELTRRRAGRTTLAVATSESKVVLSGATSLHGDVVMANTDMDLSGATSVHIGGIAGDCIISTSGASDFKAGDAQCVHLKIVSSGACSNTVEAGQVETMDVKVSGASSAVIRCVIERGAAEASGASSIHVSKVNGEFVQKASGVSSISSAAN